MEGLATYLEMRVGEVRDGSPPVAERARRTARRMRAAVERDPRLRRFPMIDYGRELMTGSSYPVGALLFAALEARLGRKLVDAIVGGYYRKYHGTGGSTMDLVRLASDLSDGASDPVFETWMLTTRWADELQEWFPEAP